MFTFYGLITCGRARVRSGEAAGAAAAAAVAAAAAAVALCSLFTRERKPRPI